jgi:hypothetical protein
LVLDESVFNSIQNVLKFLPYKGQDIQVNPGKGWALIKYNYNYNFQLCLYQDRIKKIILMRDRIVDNFFLDYSKHFRDFTDLKYDNIQVNDK